MNATLNKKVRYRNLGTIDYKQAWDLQEEIFSSIIDRKIYNRNNEDQQKLTENHLLVCQHPHVYTLGKSGDASHLLLNDEGLQKASATYYKINRGGDITYHGPGQLVAYPLLDLDNFFTDIHKYLRLLEEAVILVCADYGVKAGRIDGLTGVWIDFEGQPNPRKICAMGVKSSRWVTMHGIGFNINTDLSYFGNIVPCGIQDKAVTSLAKEVGHELIMEEVEQALVKHMAELFEMEIEYQD
ncbi:lipoyl(octanoyl) transferase LipB [Aureibacter tunicatorum]|uniref:Octanoyltransferase n=1 Tax=Aureibacter tunicatorum TaxID=866807 RepID=A0AAE3XQL9_9BACT|nr:lipoyl(octanoyl) transferase LipB [Aureibacter tunicatorum]MDR6240239.1 lipoyl(octanoyl) transferase [Aureibacter tunicatorum]BDD05880.1 octanoyltransferase [Aureibacter tunicatorum]